MVSFQRLAFWRRLKSLAEQGEHDVSTSHTRHILRSTCTASSQKNCRKRVGRRRLREVGELQREVGELQRLRPRETPPPGWREEAEKIVFRRGESPELEDAAVDELVRP